MPSGDSAKIRAGLLIVGLERDNFFEVWGPPDGPHLVGRDEQLQGKKALNVWIYEKRGVELVLDDEDLVAWRSGDSR